jgi:hypothetical protein
MPISLNNAGGVIQVISTLNLSSLKDVVISNLTDGQILKYNASTQKWENKDEQTGGGGGGFTIFVQADEPTTDVAGDFWYEVTGNYP